MIFSPVFSTKNCLIEDMISSLEIIIIVGMISKIALDRKTHQIKTIQTSNLSANKSRRAPKEDVFPVFLAMYPSK